ncbi:CCC motif membrane protein [uncultured Gelidibacter sp.]|uniref:CCC motif membrane protein n=1 Tax=uncultured Gelidibacter sp. TaxID=259318 RepID=UPI00262B9C5B|nr:CCC motif membrane protein [uncultured Gelidibacter sp.]
MEKQQLPNSTLILVFGIISIVTCCCYGVIGLPLGIIALVMANKATALYASNPELYTGFQNVKTGKILAIIGIVLNSIFLLYVIYMFATLGSEGIQQMSEELMRGMNEGMEQ